MSPPLQGTASFHQWRQVWTILSHPQQKGLPWANALCHVPHCLWNSGSDCIGLYAHHVQLKCNHEDSQCIYKLYIYICIYIYIYVYLSVDIFMYIYVCIYICVYMYVCIYIYVDTYVCVYIYASIQPYIHPSIHLSIHPSAYPCTQIHLQSQVVSGRLHFRFV